MEKKIFKCFVSSPSDCLEERKICEKVILEINRGIGDYVGMAIEPLMWEYDVVPDMGNEAQAIIDKAIGDKYEIFIGIMYSRFGTPTKTAGSGTEHEFDNAYRRKKNDIELPKILFYFNKKEVKLNSVDDSKSYIKVQEFQEKLKSKGLFWHYNGGDDFAVQLKNHLELYIKEVAKKNGKDDILLQKERVEAKLSKRLEESLKAFSTDPNVWIEPILSITNNISGNPSENYDNRIDLNIIIDSPNDYIIKSPPEFGLTCLSHFLVLNAWKKGQQWIYLDSKSVKPHNVINAIKREINDVFGLGTTRVNCIILDSWIVEKSGSLKIAKTICEEYLDIPIIIMQTIDNANFYAEEDKNVKIERSFSVLHLLALPQNQIRDLIIGFNKIKLLDEDENIILKKVTADLRVLNLHRTAKNCLTILKASNKQGFDESPVNRTKFIEIVLSVIFEEYDIPTYNQKKPDLKDCEFVLGRFTEILIKKNDYEFTKKFFIDELSKFCKEKFVEIDLNYLFEILCANHIFSNRHDIFYFKSSFWLFYFAGHRMFLDNPFCRYIFESKKYVNYPEVIEFYTGIDRNRTDALKILLNDVTETCDIVQNKLGLPASLNPYVGISWDPDQQELEKMQDLISEDVISSKLPDIIKDRYEDKKYNQIKPYHQEIRTILENYSLITLMKKISASSRALRNSDYADIEIKKELLNEIVRSWNQISIALIAIAPMLAEKGSVSYEGAAFVLDENDFKGSVKQKHFQILRAIPKNIVDYFMDDLFSLKINPLIVDKINIEENSINKHELILMIIRQRPKDWKTVIEDYISDLNKNSFFLSDLAIALAIQYHYQSSEFNERRQIEYLYRMCLAKHKFGDKKPGISQINKISVESLRKNINNEKED